MPCSRSVYPPAGCNTERLTANLSLSRVVRVTRYCKLFVGFCNRVFGLFYPWAAGKMSSCTDLYTSILAPGVQCSPTSTKINRSWYIVATHFGVLKLTQPEPPNYKTSSSFRSTLSPSDSCLAFAVLSPSQIFNLILSFPLLKNLTVATHCEVSVDSDDNPNESPTDVYWVP